MLIFTASPEQRLRGSFVVACTEKISDESVNPVLLAASVNAMKTTKNQALLMSTKNGSVIHIGVSLHVPRGCQDLAGLSI